MKLYYLIIMIPLLLGCTKENLISNQSNLSNDGEIVFGNFKNQKLMRFI